MLKPGYIRLMAASVAAVSLHALLFTLLPAHQDTALLAPEGSLQVELLAQKHAAPSHATTERQNQLAAHTGEPSRPLRPRLQLQQPPLMTAALLTPGGTLQTELLVQKHAAPSHEATDQQNQSTAHTERPSRPPSPRLQQQQPISMTARPPAGLATVQRVAEALQESQAEKLETVAMYEAIPEPAAAVALSATRQLAADQPDRSSDASSGATVPQDIQKHILAQVHYPMQARRRGWQGRAEFRFDVHQQTIHAVTLLASTGHPILDRAARRGLALMRQIPLSNGLYRMPVVFRLQ